jgi:transcriptional regulator with XRE-family HTH domain
MNTEQIVAQNVRIHRARLKLSQTQLAEQAGISQSYIGKIEAGRGNLTLEVLDALADALGRSAADLVTETALSDKAAYGFSNGVPAGRKRPHGHRQRAA